MRKPTFYLWRSYFSSQEEYLQAKERYKRMGFRVVTFMDGKEDRDIQEGICKVIKNHMTGERVKL